MIGVSRVREWLPRASVGLACTGLALLGFAANKSASCAGPSWRYGFSLALGCFALAGVTGWATLVGPRRDADWRFGPKLAYLGITLGVMVPAVRLATNCGSN